MKKLIAMILVLLTVLACCACGGKPGQTPANETAKPADNGGNSGEGSGSGADNGNNGSKAACVLDGSMTGVLQKVKEQDALRINGLLVTTDSGHHDYKPIEELIKGGYKTEGLYDEFMLNEWFAFYGEIEGGTAAMVIVLPNSSKADPAGLKTSDLISASEALSYPIFCEAALPETENYGRLFSAYVHEELGEGLYNVYFANGEDICYVVQLRLVPSADG